MSVRRFPLAFPWLVAACAGSAGPPRPEPAPAPAPAASVTRPETVTVVNRDPALERELAQAQLRILEQETVIEDLQARLDEAQREVVRSLAKLQTSATRAEAASAMAEAEVAVQSLERRGGSTGDVARARRLLDESATEFTGMNYGGALYLANQVKTVASQRAPLGAGERTVPGEQAFALEVSLETTARSNVRDGPSTGYRVLFTLEAGAVLTGQSHTDTWVRVTVADGRTGWIYQGLVRRR